MNSKMVPEFNILIGRNFKSEKFLSEINTSLDEYLLHVIRRSDDRVYMIDSKTNNELTLSEYVNQSYNLAAELQSLGCKSGTIVGIISENCIEYLVVILATLMTGATLTCFNPCYTTGELHHVFSISSPTIMFCSSQNYEKVKRTNEMITCIKHIISLDTASINTSILLSFSNLSKASSKKFLKVTKDPEDTAVILYSSGTTGFSKGVMLSHRNCIFTLKVVQEENLHGLRGKFSLGNLPIFHVFGFLLTLYMISSGHTVVVMDRFDGELFLSTIEKYKIKGLYLVPTIVVFLLKNALVDKYDISSVENVIIGGACLRKETEQKIIQKLKLKYLQQAYGMTESTAVCTIKDRESTKTGTCGSVVPGIKLKIVHLDTGKTLGVRETGEICTTGPHVMKGYYRNEEATREIIDDEGWLHTGDIGYYDEDGELFIVDRQKDLVKYKGFQVAPAELEAMLLKHSEVIDAAVIGKPDEAAGEIPTAFVVRKASSNISEKELIHFISEMVSPQKRLRGGVIFVEEIPRNSSGKILKRVLREKLNRESNS